MVTSLKDYVTLEPDDDNADFRYNYRDTMIAQFKQQFLNKNFGLQDQGEGDQTDTFRNRIKNWLYNVIMGVQYLIIFMPMIITTMDRIIPPAVQRYFLRLEN